MPIRFLILASAIPLLTEAAELNREVLAQFREYTPEEYWRFLRARRPAAVTPQLAMAIRTSLPRDGEVMRRSADDSQKIASLSTVLRAHDREGVYLVKVVDSPQARVGLHARSVLLVTRRALRILSAAQLQAIAAHEIGHEYVWLEYEAARADGNSRRLRSLELFCDGVALLTLARIGVEPRTLIEALRLLEFSNRGNGLLEKQYSHPTLPDREDFARQISVWLGRGGSLSHARAINQPNHQGVKK